MSPDEQAISRALGSGTRLTLAILAAGTLAPALAGCLGPSTHTLAISTSYDPNLTDEEDRSRARGLGFEDGDPASRGEARAAILVATSPVDDPVVPENVTRNATVGLGHHAVPLAPDGSVSIRIRTGEPPRVRIQVGGAFPASDCQDGAARYDGGTEHMPAYEDTEGELAGTGGFLPALDADRSLAVSFGIECPPPDG